MKKLIREKNRLSNSQPRLSLTSVPITNTTKLLQRLRHREKNLRHIQKYKLLDTVAEIGNFKSYMFDHSSVTERENVAVNDIMNGKKLLLNSTHYSI